MKNVRINVSTTLTLAAVLALSMVVVGIQQLNTMLKKSIAEGRSIRVSEAASCAETQEDVPHFSGCSSII